MHNHDQSVVTVRVWTFGFNPNYPGANVGHISVETSTSSTQADISSTGSGQGFLEIFFRSREAPNQGSQEESSFSIEMALDPVLQSPDSLVELLKKTKAAEEKLHPQPTQSLHSSKG